jgi:hypothetical protein
LPRPEFFVVPKEVALRMGSLGEKPIRQANRFGGFTIVKRFDFDSCFASELLQYGLCVDAILRRIQNDFPICMARAANREKQACGYAQIPGNRPHTVRL